MPNKGLRGRLLLALGASVFCALLYSYRLTLPLDRVVFDTFNELLPLQLPEDILIVAIDESSLAEFGRWPWARERHVELLRKLQGVGTRAIAIDILFVEPYANYPEVDELLATEIKALGNVILPVFIGKASAGGALWEIPPIDVLGYAAAGMGHVHIEVASDGVAREVFLYEGLGSPRWPHFTLALAERLAIGFEQLPGVSDPDVLSDPDPESIIRSHANFLRFIGPAGTIPRISYADVASGRVSPDNLRDKIVFVGATAAGHTDNITTSLGQIPGVEVNANIFEALRTDKFITAVNFSVVSGVSFVLVFLTIIFSLRMPPRVILAVLAASVLLVFAGSLLLFGMGGVWVSPVPLAITFLLTYPLWSWLRLAVAMDFMRGQLKALETESKSLSFVRRSNSEAVADGDAVEVVLAQLDRARQEATYNHELVRQTLEEMTSGVMLADVEGVVLLANHRAKELLGIQGRDEHGAALLVELSKLEPQAGADIRRSIEGLMGPGDSFSFECFAPPTHRDVLLQGAQIGLDRLLLIFVITDVTELKLSEKRRIEALNFLSHDLRAPMTSVLALLESARDETADDSNREVLGQVEGYIRKNLSYAEDFIHLSKLDHSTQPNTDICDAASLIDNAVAQLFHSAARRGIEIRITYTEDDGWLYCDRHLVERALTNLIDNALKHSEDDSVIEVETRVAGGAVEFIVSDEGAGIDPSDMGRIFEAFQQGKGAKEGVGLGLRFALVVTETHGGTLRASNRMGKGASFSLRLPFGSESSK